MKNVETKERMWKEFLGSTKLSNIISSISVVVSIISLLTASKAMQTVENNVKAANVGSIQTANEIVNEGISVEDVDYISKNNDREMMNKAYGAEDILKLVEETPNLSFYLLWHGSPEEYEAIDWDKLPPYIKIEMYDEKSNTFSMSYN